MVANTRAIVTLGIDVGSSAVKVAVVKSSAGSGRARTGAEIVASVTERTHRRDQREVIALSVSKALRHARITRADVSYLATTGEGELVEDRTGHFYGMTAHARGALFLEPDARAVLDVGALHGRAMKIDDAGKVVSYEMTSQCASGSGQFLENISRYLGVTLEEVGTLSQRADSPEKVSSVCAVLAETDVINMVSRGITVPNILRGIHESMAGRFVKLLRKVKAEGVVLVTGGLSADCGLQKCLQAATYDGGDLEFRTDPRGIFAGALGAALWGAYRFERLAQSPADAPS
ncbi:MAG: benzoyl-CoA reductase subunit D [Deltaproteobacteria bacterium]|nr:benzoyl-CoA reductase subunit D [Deltaproteobacteria bacterium]